MKGISEFKDWLVSKGAISLGLTSEWEVLRVKTCHGTLVVYRDKHGKETWPSDLQSLLNSFNKNESISSISPDKKPRSNQRHQVKALIERDGNSCWFCGLDFSEWKDDRVTIEHLVPKAHGGPDHISNLVLSCEPCNKKAGTLSVAEKVDLRELSGGSK